jgi:hypothetical protein
MTEIVSSSAARRLALAAVLSLASAGAPAACVVVGTCAAANQETLLGDLRLTNGAVLKPGRNPPSLYFCPDLGLAAGQAAGAPTPNTFELQYRDLNARGTGHVRARLMRKNLATGAAGEVVRLSSTPSTTVATVSSPVNAIDLERYVYFVLVELATPLEPLEAHRVCLTSR